MSEDGGPLPPRDEQKQALAALWLVGTVGAGSFVVYDANASGADLPLVLVPLLYLALVGATAAWWYQGRN
jgi:hypothetical protein